MLAINNDYKNDIPAINAIEEQIKNIAKSGFSHVHWCHDWNEEYMYCDIEMIQIKELLDNYGLKVKSIHASEGGFKAVRVNGKMVDYTHKYRNTVTRKDYTSPNEYTRLAGVELIKNRVNLAERLDTKEIVLHMQLPFKEFEESPKAEKIYWQQVFKSFDELKDYCAPKGIKIAVENLMMAPVKNEIEQFDKLFARYDFNFMGFCFDTGHGAIMYTDDPLFLVRKYQSRLIAAHIHQSLPIDPGLLNDDMAVLKHDVHQVPDFVDEHWEDLAKIIAESPYELPIILEVVIPADQKNVDMAFLNNAREKGQKFTEMVKGYQKSSK